MTLGNVLRPLPVIVFALLSLIPLASIPTNWLWPWPHPNSMPAGAPADFPRRFNPGTPKAVERWFDDRIRRHLPLLAVNTAYQFGVLRRSTHPGVTIGRDGWLFWTDEDDRPGSMANFRGKLRLSDAEVGALDRQLITMHEALSACGIRSLVIVAPNKQSVDGEYLSASALNVKTALDDVLPRLDPRARAMVLDLRVPLRAAKAQNPDLPLYDRTDTHWNALGAYYGYQATIDSLATTMPVPHLALAPRDQFTIEVHPGKPGDLAVKMLSAKSWFAATAVELHRKVDAAAPPGSPRLMLIGDSFADALLDYFKPHFSSIHYEHFLNIEAAPAHGKPSVVVFEIVERYLPHLATLKFDWTKFCKG
jgi:hypothetical protein